MSFDKDKANQIGERLISNSPSAKEEFVDFYQKKIYNLAIRFTGSADEGFDLAQEIFLRAFEKIALYQSGTDFHAWFMHLAVNQALNYRSKIKRNPSFLSANLESIQELSATDNGNDSMERSEIQKQVKKLLSHLPKRERLVIILQVWEERKVKEIAEIMGTSAKSVESLLGRARKRLKRIYLKSEGYNRF